ADLRLCQLAELPPAWNSRRNLLARCYRHCGHNPAYGNRPNDCAGAPMTKRRKVQLGEYKRERMKNIEKRETRPQLLWKRSSLYCLCLLLCFFCSSARAQNGNETAPRYEVSGTYSYVRGNAGNYGATFNVNGASASGSFNLNPRL